MASPRWADPVDRLGCLRGISALTGLALSVEIGDWTRFTGSSIGAYVGLVPTDYSSGTSRVQGSITKAGNAHVRRLLIDAARHHRAAYRNPGPTMRARWAKVDPALKARGHAGNRRLGMAGTGRGAARGPIARAATCRCRFNRWPLDEVVAREHG